MIYPTTLGNKAKTTRHPETLGRVLCVLCGNPHIKREDLTESELEALDELALALEQGETSRARERERVAQYRRKKCGTVPYSTVQYGTVQGDAVQYDTVPYSTVQYGTVRNDQTDRQTVSQTDKQTDKQTDSVCANAHARTREDLPVDKDVEGEVRDPTVPAIKEVVAIATTAMNIPETYARWWYGRMQAVGWRTTSGLAINHANWRPMLAAWHNKAGEKELAEAQAQARQAAKPAPRVFTAKDWAPCHACAEFVGGQCQRGYTIPPELRKHPIPVEQCNYYERKDA